MNGKQSTLYGPEQTTIEYKLLLVGDRLRRYLAKVDPSRTAQATEILKLYHLLSVDQVTTWCSASAAIESQLEVLVSVMMSDLARHYGVTESHLQAQQQSQQQAEETERRKEARKQGAAVDWFFDFAVRLNSPEAPRSTTEAQFPETMPPAMTSAFATPRVSHPEIFTIDHSRYAKLSISPPGFDRLGVRCTFCGIEALNPLELARHKRMRHPHASFGPEREIYWPSSKPLS